ncbi:MAG TPA: FHA domain-containing protein [Woeseiaceae bacterium]|jgi:type II secretory pathway predicted ATPase ExeA
MTRPQLAPSRPVEATDAALPDTFITDGQRNALERLQLAYNAGLPLATLIGDGKSAASFVLGRFLENKQDDDTAMARISKPCDEATAGMREIIRAIGFQPKDMNIADLEKIFSMFLSYQRTHRRRTIICVEEAQDSGAWMLDKIRRLVELETAGKFGLMVVLSGRPALNRLLGEPPLNAIRAQTRERIYLAPLTEAESREYVQRRVEAGSNKLVADVFDYHALGVLHELSDGVPDALRDLCSTCLELYDNEKLQLVTLEVVQRAAEKLHLAEDAGLSGEAAEPVTGKSTQRIDARLVANLNGELLQEQALNRGHVLIGRDVMCDICVNHPTVSRYHALVVNSPRGVKVVDLGSTNGTYINGRKFRQYALLDKDKLSIGASEVHFFAGSDRCTPLFDTERTDHFEPQDADIQMNGTERIRGFGTLSALRAANSSSGS